MRSSALWAVINLSIACSLQAQLPTIGYDTLFVSDRFITDSTTTGAVIVAKFRTAESRSDLLSLDAVVDSSRPQPWLLQHILVTLDLNGNGWVAIWSIAGPRRVIDAHLARVRALAAERRVIYDHEIRLVPVRCACS